jgi:hypothetical protein
MAWLIILLLLGVAIHGFMSLKYNYDWIGHTIKKVFIAPSSGQSVTDLYPIPAAPYMDRFESYTRIPKMKENASF